MYVIPTRVTKWQNYPPERPAKISLLIRRQTSEAVRGYTVETRLRYQVIYYRYYNIVLY